MVASAEAAGGPDAAQALHYWSSDSLPRDLTRPLPLWVAPAVLATFVAASVVLAYAVNRVPALTATFHGHDFFFSRYEGGSAIPLRAFIIAFYFAYACFMAATPWGRVQFFLRITLTFLMICALFDAMNTAIVLAFDTALPLLAAEVVSGLFGFFIFSFGLLNLGNMPPQAATTPFSSRFKWPASLTIVVVVTLAAILAHAVNGLALPLIRDLRWLALLGGIGPGVFLFLPILYLLLYWIGVTLAFIRSPAAFAPPITVAIPAHNEAHVVGRTIAAVDAAAARYAGSIHILVVNNVSTDHTVAAARAALAAASHCTSALIEEPVPGKSHALNRALAVTETEFLVRIDADTQVLPNTIRRAMTHFHRPDVGVVGGLPLPPGDGPFDYARMLEIVLKLGLHQVAYGAIDSVVGIPGMFAVYRTRVLREIGGFVQGMNGEDTDASLRIGELGYRVIADPDNPFISEVPLTLPALREQRMRWFRSVYHVSARNRLYIDGQQLSPRGKVLLPFMLLNSARRAMTLPLLMFGIIMLTLDFNPDSTLTAEAVLAVVLGSPLIMATLATLLSARPRALLGLSDYFFFRLLRSYLTLESLLSIRFDRYGPTGPTVAAGGGRPLPAAK